MTLSGRGARPVYFCEMKAAHHEHRARAYNVIEMFLLVFEGMCSFVLVIRLQDEGTLRRTRCTYEYKR